ncbi:DUF2141 domain-containing protein [Sabulilitoribacter multivorans]|uniref:DUF2141 domain-containing protein n=1 Tax=Flaviramulus multivorans TaxID=1304750 RepID=A0ABS9IKX5_9FLAO|nr:DUF2141 domain-containing protein [Flaviramulus multivorans]MCF7561268.1 DUF2141 domain-containing protein [Flaviramulus multivorans]
MKALSLIITLLLSVTFSFSQEEKTGQSITVTIENITNNNGNVLLSLHTEETFMKGPGIQNLESKIVDGKISITFDNVEPRTYAIMALHDVNENRRMDFEENGMPKESYGMSNNPISYGPPQYAQAKFDLKNEDLEMKIVF